ncbi:MAG: UDP-N-acetylglucosamine 2-epimerase (non-hydrolyzing) [Phycisphaerae bacterium]|jgi:UDP-N-acetylglucosamine 2-epimerase (non-hydrolysing)|nr:UDP-N-acetylglucosamine 2-epimerase (non-hydrolyzing) [Phycisphaerae bacterium]MDP7289153.1 UDP-N-acetylglucosamine 2-epimerase (non-hydrolyzing) [Phycisphaerae bacterium]
MSKAKVLTIVGTRPEVIKLSRVIPQLELHFDHVLAHTGQNYDYELNEIFFDELGIRKPDHFLEAAGETTAQTIANVIVSSDKLMEQIEPDALLLLGDTDSCLSAISAKRRKIPIFHMEAGNRCFDARVPEEINRKIVDHISDINMPYTEHARRYLLDEGVRPETIVKTGSPMREVLAHYQSRIDESDILGRLGLDAGKYFVVSCHRQENVDSPENFADFLKSLDAIAEKWGRDIIVSTHPRTRKKLEELGGPASHKLVRFLKPLGLVDYVCLQLRAACVVSDSGTLTEEASIMHFPAVTIRQAHERPEGMDQGVLVMSELKSDRVIAAIEMVIAQFDPDSRGLGMVADYDVPNVSMKVARTIASYIDYVNRTVWRK